MIPVSYGRGLENFILVLYHALKYRNAFDRYWELYDMQREYMNDEGSLKSIEFDREQANFTMLRMEGWFAGALFGLDLDMPSGHQEIMCRVIMDATKED